MSEPVVVVTVDVDHFKKINDTHGHAAGDAVLAAVGRTLASTIREVDTAFRVGGEEFAVLLSGSGSEGATIAAERLRVAIAANRIAAGDANARSHRQLRRRRGDRTEIDVRCVIACGRPCALRGEVGRPQPGGRGQC